MKKIIGAILLVVLCFLVGCQPDPIRKYELDLSSVENGVKLEDFNLSLIKIKEIFGDDVRIIECDETMFRVEDSNKLQTVGTHSITVVYKFFTEQFTITILDNSVSVTYTYELDLSGISSSMHVDNFDLSLVKIKKVSSLGNIEYIECNSSMLSSEDIEKLNVAGDHNITVNYEGNVLTFNISLYKDEAVTYTYELDLGYLRDETIVDDFELRSIVIKETDSKGNVRYIDCDETMISSADLAKLSTAGTHVITVSYNGFSKQVTVKLIEKPETYTYELDLGYLREETLVDDFELRSIVIKETDSKGNVRYIDCDETMISSADLAKLSTAGTHVITVSYNGFTAEVTVKLITMSSSGGNDDVNVDVFTSTLAYYSSANGLKGTELKAKLRTIITSTHKKITTYAELKTYLQKADEDPNNPSNMLLFYNGVSVKKSADMSIWNREHVWPKSLGWFSESGAGADMHHLRPCNPSVNSSRGNTKFGTSSGYYDPSKFGVDYRGDVARIIFYLMVRYTEADRYTFTSVAQSKELLLEWNRIDPVSETETIRNDYTYTVQGNRNPFIDHPETADLIWGTTSLLNNNDNINEQVIEIVFYLEEKRRYDYI